MTDFLIADLHLGHEKACTTFKRADGSPLRPFINAQEMDETIVARWNERVRPQDKVYVLGDVVIARKHMDTLGRLQGKLRLVRGNHDIFPIKEYMKYFGEVYACRVLSDMILTHIPLHPESVTERFSTNVHGHLHSNEVTVVNQHNKRVPDSRYLCVSVEHTNFAPVSLEEARELITRRKREYPI